MVITSAFGSEAAVVRGLPRLPFITGVDGELLMATMANAEAKQQVKQEATDAVQHDLFGVPFMVADGESFFGADRMEYLDRYLASRAG